MGLSKNSMIDIHSHIIPGVDDGARNMDETLAMARLAVAEGTTVLFATPHVMDQQELRAITALRAQVQDVQAALAEAEIPLQVEPGCEISPMDGMPEAYKNGVPLTMGTHGKYLLLDTPLTVYPVSLAQMVFSLQLHGLKVILAHPERALPIQQNPQLLEELVLRGVLLQINASSLLHGKGDPHRETALILLRQQWVHFMASDAHSPTQRRPGMAQAAQALTDIVGDQVAQELLEANGRRLLNGETVPSTPLAYSPPKRSKGLFGLFRR